MEGAKIHAENSIRQKNQALNYRRMSARIDAVAARVQTAVTTKQVDCHLEMSGLEICLVEYSGSRRTVLVLIISDVVN